MVILNTQQRNYDNLSFRYFLEVPRCDCIFGSARETTGKAHLFLIFKGQDKIYKRNGRNQTWQELRTGEAVELRPVLAEAIGNQNIPRYSTEAVTGIAG